MWLNYQNSVCVAAGTNNSTAASCKHSLYQAPEKPEEFRPFTPTSLAEPAAEHRSTFRTDSREFVYLYFRVRRGNYKPLLWHLIATGYIRKDRAYEPDNLAYWTIGIRIKVRAQLALGRVMEAFRARLGINCPGIKFCLDGFYGMRDFSDIFNNPNACPWMEVSDFSTVQSLRLKDADSIFVSVAPPAMIEAVQVWRRKLQYENLKTALDAAASHLEDGAAAVDQEESDVIGSIDYDSQWPVHLL